MFRRFVTVAVAAVAAILLFGQSASAQTVTPQPGEGMIAMTTRVCGSSAGWQQQAAHNGLTDPYWLYLGHSYDLECGTAPAPAPTRAPDPAPASVPASSGWVNPLPGTCITSGFGARWGSFHYGTDLGGAWGTPIHAAAAGTAYLGWEAGGAGNYITINHGGGVYTLYMHQSSFAVGNGQWVNAGQVIGYVGATGDAQGAHLHFEVRPNGNAWGTAVDAVPFMAARGVWLGC
jgi:murein DD-endopeptidase MepM/ murein hydrolase activator NlpD